MNFTDSPYERMMKQVPRQGGGKAKPYGSTAPPPRKKLKKEQEAYRNIIISGGATSGQIGPKSE